MSGGVNKRGLKSGVNEKSALQRGWAKLTGTYLTVHGLSARTYWQEQVLQLREQQPHL